MIRKSRIETMNRFGVPPSGGRVNAGLQTGGSWRAMEIAGPQFFGRNRDWHLLENNKIISLNSFGCLGIVCLLDSVKNRNSHEVIMKINFKTSIIGSTIAAMLAFAGTAQAQSNVFNPEHWGVASYGNGGAWSVLSQDGNGNFSVGTGTLSSGFSVAGLFATTVLGVGEYIELTGSFDINGNVGGTGPFRFGIYNEDSSIGTWASGVWSGGGANWTGYTFAPSTYGAAPAGDGEIGAHYKASWASTFNGYGLGTSTTNPLTIGNDTFNFDIKITQLSLTATRLNLSLVGQTNATPYSESFSNITDNGSHTPNVAANNVYDAVGFYLSNAGTATTYINFHNVTITTSAIPIPEPASMALLCGGLPGLLLMRRSRK